MSRVTRRLAMSHRLHAVSIAAALAIAVAASAEPVREPSPQAPGRLRGVHFNPVSPSPPGTGHWLADYHLIRDRVNRELDELIEETAVNFLDLMVLIPTTLQEKATPPSDDAEDVRAWANMTTLDNLVAFLDDCAQRDLVVEVDLATNMWIPARVDADNHIGRSEWWPEADETPWTESVVWYTQIIRYVEKSVRDPRSIACWVMMGNHQWGGAEPVTWDCPEKPDIAAYTERFVKEVWPRFREAAARPVGSPILLPIFADDAYWNEKTPEVRLSAFRNVKRWLVDDLAMPPDYWVMSTYPCCDPAQDGVHYLREIVRILGPDAARRIISTDFKGPGHPLDGQIVDKSHLSDAEVLRWHFDKVDAYGFAGWWIWSYMDRETDPTGLRRLDGAWKRNLTDIVRRRAGADADGQPAPPSASLP